MVPRVKVPTAVAPHPPTESEMAAVLGDAYPAFQAMVGRAGTGAAEWPRYTKRLHDSIRKAKVYPEGRPVSVVVRKPSDLAKVEELIAIKLEATARPSQSKVRSRGGRTGE